MGEKRDPEKTEKAKSFIAGLLTGLFLFSCAAQRSFTGPQTQTISGTFRLYSCQKGITSGFWFAEKQNGKIIKIFLYTKFGMPIREIEGKKILDLLSRLEGKKEYHLKERDLEVLKTGNHIIIIGKFGWLSIEIKPPGGIPEGL